MATNTADAFGNFLFAATDALANKPQKTSQLTTTTEIPLELEDMRERRDTIGQARQALANSLRNRETRGYTFGNALANLGGQTIPGQIDWLGGLRAAGGAYTAPTNAEIDRLTKDYDMARTDLADALMYDKAMGTRQIQDASIGYGNNVSTGFSGDGDIVLPNTVPFMTPEDWNYMITNFDKDRPDEAAYRNQNEKQRAYHNWRVGLGWGDRDEMPARELFNQTLTKDYLPVARNVLKGSGPITDFEDKKYTSWLSNIKDPVQLKDVTVKMIRDVAGRNNWTTQQYQNALRGFGLQSGTGVLRPSMERSFPERVKSDGSTAKKDKIITTSSGAKVRIISE